MILLKILFIFACPLISQGKEIFSAPTIRVANNSLNNSFDPFIDYGEFQDNVTEQEDINFFEKGRALNVSFLGGYEAITFNMRQIYGDSPTVTGFSLGFFFDLNFAMHLSFSFPHSHYNSILNHSPIFSILGLDFKYYFNKQNLTKTAAQFLNPYVVFGPFWFRVTNHLPQNTTPPPTPDINTNLQGPTAPGGVAPTSPNISQDERSAVSDFTAFGFKLGFGVEIPLVKQTYMGFEVAYLYTSLDIFENADLSSIPLNGTAKYNPYKTIFDRLIFPDTPNIDGYRFYGDLLTVLFVFGVNF